MLGCGCICGWVWCRGGVWVPVFVLCGLEVPVCLHMGRDSILLSGPLFTEDWTQCLK